MLIQDIATGTLIDLSDVLATEFIDAGLARRAQRRAVAPTGPALAEVMDPNLAVVEVPAEVS